MLLSPSSQDCNNECVLPMPRIFTQALGSSVKRFRDSCFPRSSHPPTSSLGFQYRGLPDSPSCLKSSASWHLFKCRSIPPVQILLQRARSSNKHGLHAFCSFTMYRHSSCGAGDGCEEERLQPKLCEMSLQVREPQKMPESRTLRLVHRARHQMGFKRPLDLVYWTGKAS